MEFGGRSSGLPVDRPDGTVQLYLRKKGLPVVRLPDGLDEEVLVRHVAGLLAELSPDPLVQHGTLRAALRSYELENPDFRGLADSTKYIYRLFLKEFEDDLGHLAVSAFTPSFVDRLKANGDTAPPTSASRSSRMS